MGVQVEALVLSLTLVADGGSLDYACHRHVVRAGTNGERPCIVNISLRKVLVTHG